MVFIGGGGGSCWGEMPRLLSDGIGNDSGDGNAVEAAVWEPNMVGGSGGG